jgi:hypothetical protein
MASRHDISCDSQTGGRITAIHPFGIEMRDEYKLVHTDADMTERLMEELDFRQKSPLSVGERSGQLRPYVRPVARRSPLAIMGVRLRVRHQSVWRARGNKTLNGIA